MIKLDENDSYIRFDLDEMDIMAALVDYVMRQEEQNGRLQPSHILGGAGSIARHEIIMLRKK